MLWGCACVFAKAGEKKWKGGWLNRWLSAAPQAEVAEQSPPRSHTNSVHKREAEWESVWDGVERLGSLIQSTLLFWGGRALLRSSPFRRLLFLLPNFFFSRGNNLKKKRKERATDTWLPAVREKERWGGERQGGEEGGGTGSRRGAGRPVCPDPLGRGEGTREGRAKPLRRPALPQPAAGTALPRRAGKCPVVPLPSTPSSSFPHLPKAGCVCVCVRVFGGGCYRFLKESGKLCLLLFLY